MRKQLNVQQLTSLGLTLLLLHPASLVGQQAKPPVPAAPLGPLAARVALAAAAAAATPAPAPAAVKRPVPVAAQIPPALAGQSSTLLPDGSTLVLGGIGAAGAAARVAAKPATGLLAQLAVTLRRPRAWHSATVLPDGSVLVFGGLDQRGLVADAEIYDPARQTSELLAAGLAPRAHHTATLLTDGRVLVAGGIGPDGQPLNKLELWNPRTRALEQFEPRLTFARQGHTARLLASGNVEIRGGLTAAGSPADPEVVTVVQAVPPASPAPADELALAASIPANEAQEVALDAVIALRFTRPLRVTSVNAVTVTMRDDRGPVPARIVPAEAGMLAFVTPEQPLAANTAYTVAIAGPRDANDFAFPPAEIHFTTGAEATLSQSARPKAAEKEKDDPAPTPLKAPAGVTALAGHSRTSQNAKYLPNLTVNLDCNGKISTTKTDSLGRFLLTGEAGHCVMEIDGITGQPQGKEYGRYFVGVDLVAGLTMVLPYTVWMTSLDRQFEVSIPSPTTQEIAITHPRLKGLELRLPSGTVIRDYNGNVITKVGLTPIPVRRPPFPLPNNVNVPIYFTMQPGGAFIEVGGSRYSPGKGAQLIYPNRGRAPAGFVQQFWDYDPDGRGWFVYGQGKTAPNRRNVVPDSGVVISRFSGAMVASPGPWPICCPGPPNCPECIDNDPVQINSGVFLHDNTDLALPDVLPIALTRSYRQNDHVSRAFGIGTSHPYDMALVGAGPNFSAMDLASANGISIHYTRTSTGTGYADAVLENSTAPGEYFKSKITWNGVAWELRMKDGLTYVFQFPAGGPGANGVDRLERYGVTAIRDRYGNTITITRDSANGMLSRITSPNGRWIAFTYDSLYRITTAKDNGGNTYSYEYDEGGRLIKVTNPLNDFTEYTYDSSDQILTIKDPRGNVYLTNEYNDEGRVIKQTQADGGFYLNTYTEDANGNVIQTDVVDPRGNVRRFIFNIEGYFSGGYVTSETKAFGTPIAQTTIWERQPGTNLLTAIVDPLGRRTTYVYDAKGSVTSVTRLAGTPNAVTTTLTYEPTFNQIATVADPLNHTVSYTYDNNGNLTTVSAPATNTFTLGYDTKGRITSMTMNSVGSVGYQFTGGDQTAILDQAGARWAATFDAVGRIISTQTPLGNTSRIEYDAGGRPTRMYDSLGSLTQLLWDSNNSLLSFIDPRNGSTAFAYDSSNRRTTRQDPLQTTETTEYDKNNNPIKHTDRKQQVTQISFDSLNRPTLIAYADGSTKSLIYDAGDRISQMADSIGGTIAYTYDGLDRLLTESGPNGSVTYSYDAGGRRISMTVTGQPAVTYQYDDANRVTQITQGSLSASLTYDGAGRRSSMILPNGVVVSYQYDAASRLASLSFLEGVTSLGNLTYEYDAAGRRTKVGGSLARTSLPQEIASASYNNANQLTQRNGVNLTYDANGNLTSDGVLVYTWDTRDQLIGLSGTGIAAAFTYDADGNRKTRTVNGSTTAFLHGGGNVLQEVAGGQTTNWLTGLAIDEALARTDTAGTQTLITDGITSTLALLDPTGGMLTTYTYEPFGKVTTMGAASTNSVQFAGRENDGTGLMYYRARYYNPTLGRFISEDPALTLGTNPYAYVRNDPVSFLDPFGQTEVSWYVKITHKGFFDTLWHAGDTKHRYQVFLKCNGCGSNFKLNIRIHIDFDVIYSSQSNFNHEMKHVSYAQQFWTSHKSEFDKFEGTYRSRKECEDATRKVSSPVEQLLHQLDAQLEEEQCKKVDGIWCHIFH